MVKSGAILERLLPNNRRFATHFKPEEIARSFPSDTLLVCGGIMSEDPKRELPDAERPTPSEELQAELEPLTENEQDYWDDSDMQNTHEG